MFSLVIRSVTKVLLSIGSVRGRGWKSDEIWAMPLLNSFFNLFSFFCKFTTGGKCKEKQIGKKEDDTFLCLRVADLWKNLLLSKSVCAWGEGRVLGGPWVGVAACAKGASVCAYVCMFPLFPQKIFFFFSPSFECVNECFWYSEGAVCGWLVGWLALSLSITFLFNRSWQGANKKTTET
jgi:hypothetical protein